MSQTSVGAEAFPFKAAQLTFRDVGSRRANVSLKGARTDSRTQVEAKVSQSGLEYM